MNITRNLATPFITGAQHIKQAWNHVKIDNNWKETAITAAKITGVGLLAFGVGLAAGYLRSTKSIAPVCHEKPRPDFCPKKPKLGTVHLLRNKEFVSRPLKMDCYYDIFDLNKPNPILLEYVPDLRLALDKFKKMQSQKEWPSYCHHVMKVGNTIEIGSCATYALNGLAIRINKQGTQVGKFEIDHMVKGISCEPGFKNCKEIQN